MAAQHTKEELWKMYKELPEELQEALFSVENADRIDDICEEHAIAESSRPITKQIGNVLLGIVPVQEFENILVKEVGLKKATAQEVNRRIYRAIFYPIKMELEQLHGIQTAQAPLSQYKEQGVAAQQSTTEQPEDDYIVRERPQAPEKAEKPPREEPKEESIDTYREPID